jgi:hypothetical protein
LIDFPLECFQKIPAGPSERAETATFLGRLPHINRADAWGAGAAGFYLSYVIPIYLGWRKKSSWISKRGPWNLGSSSNGINCLAILWTVFICTVMLMLSNVRSGVGIAAVIGALLMFHLASGKHKIHKPNWIGLDDAKPETLPNDPA